MGKINNIYYGFGYWENNVDIETSRTRFLPSKEDINSFFKVSSELLEPDKYVRGCLLGKVFIVLEKLESLGG